MNEREAYERFEMADDRHRRDQSTEATQELIDARATWDRSAGR